ncbi:MAG: single-stranded DNA-binding protein [Chloroflexota bacterium]|nr:single-stranded DNA-binding protein [Chloroflexota bacterium]
MSKIMIIGNVGRDPELKMTGNGRPVCEFSVAVNRVTGGGQGAERQEQTDWYRISCWGKQAETAQQIVQKGRLVFVEGRFTPREWTDREGQKRTSLEISANDFQLLDPRRDRGESMGAAPPAAAPDEAGAKFDPDDIPF